jgi:hypothetical protein
MLAPMIYSKSPHYSAIIASNSILSAANFQKPIPYRNPLSDIYQWSDFHGGENEL